eukprot:763695-Rhodomonas_salina.5
MGRRNARGPEKPSGSVSVTDSPAPMTICCGSTCKSASRRQISWPQRLKAHAPETAEEMAESEAMSSDLRGELDGDAQRCASMQRHHVHRCVLKRSDHRHILPHTHARKEAKRERKTSAPP